MNSVFAPIHSKEKEKLLFIALESMHSPPNPFSASTLKGVGVEHFFSSELSSQCCSGFFCQVITSPAGFEPLTPPQKKTQASWPMSSCYLMGGRKECSSLLTGLSGTWTLGEYTSETGENIF